MNGGAVFRWRTEKPAPLRRLNLLLVIQAIPAPPCFAAILTVRTPVNHLFRLLIELSAVGARFISIPKIFGRRSLLFFVGFSEGFNKRKRDRAKHELPTSGAIDPPPFRPDLFSTVTRI